MFTGLKKNTGCVYRFLILNAIDEYFEHEWPIEKIMSRTRFLFSSKMLNNIEIRFRKNIYMRKIATPVAAGMFAIKYDGRARGRQKRYYFLFR